jgi:hypothetical protein
MVDLTKITYRGLYAITHGDKYMSQTKLFMAKKTSTPSQRRRGRVSITFEASLAVVHAFEKSLAQREATLQMWFELALAKSVNVPVIYELNTPLQFGAYRGQELESVIRVQPDYVIWLLDNVERFEMVAEAHELLDECIDHLPQGKRRKKQDPIMDDCGVRG